MDASRCAVSSGLLESPYPLSRTRARLANGRDLTVVALGSSSTEGIGATAPEHAYPRRLEIELQALFPRSRIRVINRGVGGEDSTAMLARFERDVIAEQPDLLIWQAGVNSALRGSAIEILVADLARGIALARAHGMDVMLMGPQNAPRVTQRPRWRDYGLHVALIGDIHRVPFFPRYEIMGEWIGRGNFTMEQMIIGDGLHLTDASYWCIGHLAARMIGHLVEADVGAPD